MPQAECFRRLRSYAGCGYGEDRGEFMKQLSVDHRVGHRRNPATLRSVWESNGVGQFRLGREIALKSAISTFGHGGLISNLLALPALVMEIA